MRKLLFAAAASTLFASAATAAPMFGPDSFSQRGDVFEAADVNDDELLSRAEYLMMRVNTVDEPLVSTYRGDTQMAAQAAFVPSFTAMDKDKSGGINPTEFANAPVVPPPANVTPRWAAGDAWDPEYITVTYYLTVNPVDTDVIEGKEVVNLKGEDVGRVDRIIRTDKGRYYALLDLEGRPIYQPTNMERDQAGVPLEDILLFRDGKSLLLSARGEEYLKDAEARELEWSDYQPVDRLYRVS